MVNVGKMKSLMKQYRYLSNNKIIEVNNEKENKSASPLDFVMG